MQSLRLNKIDNNQTSLKKKNLIGRRREQVSSCPLLDSLDVWDGWDCTGTSAGSWERYAGLSYGCKGPNQFKPSAAESKHLHCWQTRFSAQRVGITPRPPVQCVLFQLLPKCLLSTRFFFFFYKFSQKTILSEILQKHQNT